MMQQLLREWPPGFGGVERVAHCLAQELGGCVYSLRHHGKSDEPLPVGYSRYWLPAIPLSRLFILFPSANLLRLLFSNQELLAHLPCPTVLTVALIAKLFRPRRIVRFYWHAFIQRRSGVQGLLESIYQWLALRFLVQFDVITTSPVLVNALCSEGLSPHRLFWLSCSLPSITESNSTSIWLRRQCGLVPRGRLIAIGRFDTYKRFDWLIHIVSVSPFVTELDLVGDGPDRQRLEYLAHSLRSSRCVIRFHGRIPEDRKLFLLAQADLLILPADRCNEAFGIVQLEAMACGIPSLAFKIDQSGMHWVSQLPDLPWSGNPSDLLEVIHSVLSDHALYQRLAAQSRQRYDALFSLHSWREQLNLLRLGSG